MAAETDLSSRAVAAGRRDIVVAVTLELKSRTHGVRPVDDADVILERNRSLVENFGSIYRSEREGTVLRSSNRSACEIQTGKERCRLAGNQARGVGRRATLHIAFGREVISARAEFVDDTRAESSGIVEHAALQRENIVSGAVVEQGLTVNRRLRDVLL